MQERNTLYRENERAFEFVSSGFIPMQLKLIIGEVRIYSDRHYPSYNNDEDRLIADWRVAVNSRDQKRFDNSHLCKLSLN